jgi:hypothetical protein
MSDFHPGVKSVPSSADEGDTPVKAKAALIDPESMAVLWANEPPPSAGSDAAAESRSGTTIDDVVPMADSLGVPEALREVAVTGVARHLRVDVVSKTTGSIAQVVSIYRLPDGKLLVLSENAWVMGRGGTPGSPRRPGRRAR